MCNSWFMRSVCVLGLTSLSMLSRSSLQSVQRGMVSDRLGCRFLRDGAGCSSSGLELSTSSCCKNFKSLKEKKTVNSSILNSDWLKGLQKHYFCFTAHRKQQLQLVLTHHHFCSNNSYSGMCTVSAKHNLSLINTFLKGIFFNKVRCIIFVVVTVYQQTNIYGAKSFTAQDRRVYAFWFLGLGFFFTEGVERERLRGRERGWWGELVYYYSSNVRIEQRLGTSLWEVPLH